MSGGDFQWSTASVARLASAVAGGSDWKTCALAVGNGATAPLCKAKAEADLLLIQTWQLKDGPIFAKLHEACKQTPSGRRYWGTSKIPEKTERRAWLPEEDSAIVELVEKLGTKRWSAVALQLRTKYGLPDPRTGKQCRERYHNHLDPAVSKEPWTAKEASILRAKQAEIGNSWARIAKYIPGRTDNQVKNYFYSLQRGKGPQPKKPPAHSQSPQGRVPSRKQGSESASQDKAGDKSSLMLLAAAVGGKKRPATELSARTSKRNKV